MRKMQSGEENRFMSEMCTGDVVSKESLSMDMRCVKNARRVNVQTGLYVTQLRPTVRSRFPRVRCVGGNRMCMGRLDVRGARKDSCVRIRVCV